MPRTIICHYCGKIVPRNLRIKKQKYCSSRACQNARRYTTNKKRSLTSSESCLLRQARNKRWRVTHPSHEYQREYRSTHPEYVKHKGELQLECNKNRQKTSLPMIVKTYALSPQPLRDGIYTSFEIKNGKIVKTYALMPQMLAHTANASLFP